MFRLQAPYPAIQTTTVLPHPQLGDGENLMVEVAAKRAMDGTLYTYVKRKGRHRLLWTFRLTRNKALELRAFIQAYFASRINVKDHTDRVWVGNLVNNPFEFDTAARAAPAIPPMSRGEAVLITLEFEGAEDGS